MLREWLKNHILSQHGEVRANIVYCGDLLNLCKAMSLETMTLANEGQELLSRTMKSQFLIVCKVRVLKVEQ